MSSLHCVSSITLVSSRIYLNSADGVVGSYKLLLVAFAICSSRAVTAEEDHHPIILNDQSCRGWRDLGYGQNGWAAIET